MEEEKIPFEDSSVIGGVGNNDPMALLIMHKAWRDIFDDGDEKSEITFDFDYEKE